MKYSISYTCGHSGTVNLIGPHALREKRIAFLESGECFECYKQHTTEGARKQAEVLELPLLVGSDKQIAWAESLRIVKLTEMESALEHLKNDRRYRQLLLASEKISDETSAKQWIEWRYDSPEYILREVLQAMLVEPTEEQKQVEQEAQKQAEAIRRDALMEATMKPGVAVSNFSAEISLKDRTISVLFPEKREDFRQLVKSLGYDWMNGCWQRTIGTFAGTPIDRAIELGCTLLAQGFLIRVFDKDLRAQIISGHFEPEQTRWIAKRTSGEYAGWFAIQWGRDEDYYQAARKIEGSRYGKPGVIIPAVQFEQVLDFASRYDFKLSEGAQELVALSREEKERILVVTKKPISKQKKVVIGEKPPVLAVPDMVVIADELKDED